MLDLVSVLTPANPMQLNFYSLCPVSRKTGQGKSSDFVSVQTVEERLEERKRERELASKVILRTAQDFKGSDLGPILCLASMSLSDNYELKVPPQRLMAYVGGIQLPFCLMFDEENFAGAENFK